MDYSWDDELRNGDVRGVYRDEVPLSSRDYRRDETYYQRDEAYPRDGFHSRDEIYSRDERPKNHNELRPIRCAPPAPPVSPEPVPIVPPAREHFSGNPDEMTLQKIKVFLLFIIVVFMACALMVAGNAVRQLELISTFAAIKAAAAPATTPAAAPAAIPAAAPA